MEKHSGVANLDATSMHYSTTSVQKDYSASGFVFNFLIADVSVNNHRPTGAVYNIKCLECAFTYYGQTDRSIKTRVKEHQRNIVNNEPTSKIAQHANQTGHELDFDNTCIVDKEQDFHKRLFLEAWRSECDIDSKNYRINLPDIYKTLMRAHVNS